MKHGIKYAIFAALMICSIPVSAKSVPKQSGIVDVASGKTVLSEACADNSNVVDGKLDTYTDVVATEGTAWLKIDLEKVYTLKGMQIIAADGQCTELKLEVSADDIEYKNLGVALSKDIGEYDYIKFDILSDLDIRYLKILSDENFSVLEWNIYGTNVSESEEIELTNVALEKDVTVTSARSGSRYRASNITDGKKTSTDNCWRSKEGETGTQYAIVDLGAIYNVREIEYTTTPQWVQATDENEYRLIEFLGSATGTFGSGDEIKLADVGIEKLDYNQTANLPVEIPNFVRYIKVVPKNRGQYTGYENPTQFGFAELAVYADESVEYELLSLENEAAMDLNLTTKKEIETEAIFDMNERFGIAGIQVIPSNSYVPVGGYTISASGAGYSYDSLAESELDVLPIDGNIVNAMNGKTVRYLKYSTETKNELLDIYVFKGQTAEILTTEIVDFRFTDSNGNTIDTIGETVGMEAYVLNGEDDAIDVTVVLAVYDINKKMIGIAINDFTVIAKNEKRIFATAVNLADAEYVKAYIIEDEKAINPYSETKTLE